MKSAPSEQDFDDFFRFSSRGGGSTCLLTFILRTVMIQYHKKQKKSFFLKNSMFYLEIQLPPGRLRERD